MSNTRYFKWFNFIFVCLPVSGLILSSCGSHKKANITISASGNQLIYDDTKSQYLDINVTFQNMQSQNVAVVGHFFDSEIAWSDVLQFSPAAFNNTTKLIFNPAFTFADPTPLTFIFYVTANRTQSNELTINIVKGEAPLASLFSRFKNADDPIVLGSSTSNISTPSSRTVRHYATNPSYNDQAASAGIEPDDLSQSAITNNHFSYIVDHAIKGEYYWGSVDIYYDVINKPTISQVIPNNLWNLKNYQFSFDTSRLQISDMEVAFQTAYQNTYGSLFADDYSNLFHVYYGELTGALYDTDGSYNYNILSTNSSHFANDLTGITFTNFTFAS